MVSHHPQHLLSVMLQQRLTVALVLAIAFLASVNWALSPEQAHRWLAAALKLPLFCLVLTLVFLRMQRSSARSVDAQLSIQRYYRATLTMIVLALGIRDITALGLEIWVEFGDHGIDLEFERRILGLATSLTFIIIGNTMPKILTPLSVLPLSLAERVTSARRFVGTGWFVLGLTMAVAFLFLPLEHAKALVIWSIVVGSLTVLGAIIWMNLSPDRSKQ